MDFARHVEEQFDWLLKMATTPGFDRQAWRRAKELAQSDRMYSEFPERLRVAMLPEATEASPTGTPSSQP